jgi:hypothetical protein
MINLFRFCFFITCLSTYWVQSSIDHRIGADHSEEIFFLPSADVIKKLSLGYNGLMADIYWMRAVQYYGGKRLKNQPGFPLLGPLIDVATTLDPQLLHAYRFGSIFLSEQEPIGAGAPGQAIALLKKGIEHNPNEWQLYRDMGFTYYWFLSDHRRAGEAFLEGSKNPKSALWMKTFAAQLLARGGGRDTARFLWQEVYQTSDNQRMKENAREHLQKLTADEDIETLQALVNKVEAKTGRKTVSIEELVKLGFFKKRPSDPKGFPYMLDRESGRVKLSADSTIRRY